MPNRERNRTRSVVARLTVVVFWGVVTSSVSAAPTFFGPTPYLSAGIFRRDSMPAGSRPP
jgi:hypothetical protein